MLTAADVHLLRALEDLASFLPASKRAGHLAEGVAELRVRVARMVAEQESEAGVVEEGSE